MFVRLFLATVLVTAAMMPAAAQQAAQNQQQPPAAQAPAQQGSPVAKQPAIKSKEEMEAIQAIMNALDPKSRIEAADKLVADFPDSEWKSFALQMATISYQQLNDFENMMVYGERALEVDPDNIFVLLALANGLAQKTREFDLDKEEKLRRATELANHAIEVLKTAPRPNPRITDEQWEAAKNDFRAQAYEALGMVAMVRKDFAKAVEQFKKAIDVGTTPNAGTKVRLAAALTGAGNYNEAIVTLDDVLGDPQLNPVIRRIAEAERARAVKLRDIAAAKAKQQQQQQQQQ